ncbi:GlcG/HbpS family heme-binding protein [Cohnella hongkongensis]|uniref:Heme-binding protein n=1 Tax=Cohnella hongkongensis TaxID=178337 RepID=A0ABV9FB81_9BACL
MDRITLDMAIHIITAAEQRAWQLGIPVNISIVDECGDLIAFHRMDEARLAGIDIAQNKAWTSVTMQMPTADLARLALPGGDAYGVNTTNQGKVVILGGGIPLMCNKRIIGGVGVSGGSGAQDLEVAQVAVRTFDQIVGQIETTVPVAQPSSRSFRRRE